MKQSILKFSTLALAAAVIMTSFSSCKDDDDDTATPTTGTAKMMVVHASPDAPGVDLYVAGSKVNTDPVEFLDATGYLSVTEGTRNVKVNVAGTSTTVINADLPFTKNVNYTLFAVDSVSKLSTVRLTDDLTAPAAGKAHVRFVHLSPNAPAVDVAVTGGAVVFANKSFKQATDFTPLDAGTYNLEVRVAGTSTVALDLDPITLTAGKIYTVYAGGFLGGVGSQALSANIIVNN
ncbi:MAG TPA: DUF4397 domain-containing protein [Bacteroidia bacterium]|jgi:hypothetical protein|nr:DUF4397 domain-containing protein [Bacteroidia bacterium]HQK98163.1 DUF4397 domain-containing protein [Bacteroidia bacterium]